MGKKSTRRICHGLKDGLSFNVFLNLRLERTIAKNKFINKRLQRQRGVSSPGIKVWNQLAWILSEEK